MEQVVLVIHILLALAIIGLVLIQRSEGGGLGIGGGSGGLGNLATAQGTANILTRLTALFTAGFFVTSLTLAVLAGGHSNPSSILDETAPDKLDISVSIPDGENPDGEKGANKIQEAVKEASDTLNDNDTPQVPISE